MEVLMEKLQLSPRGMCKISLCRHSVQSFSITKLEISSKHFNLIQNSLVHNGVYIKHHA